MSGFRLCGMAAMFLWFLEFARAMHCNHSLPGPVDPPEPVDVVPGPVDPPEPVDAVPEPVEPPQPVEEVPGPAAAAVDEDRPAAALDEERPELAAVDEERPVPQTPVPAAALHSLSFAIDGLARAISSRPASVPGSVVPLRASGARVMGAPDSVVPLRAPNTPVGPRQRRRQRCRECGPCLAKLAAGVSRPLCETWAAVPDLERDGAGRFLPRTPAKREAGGGEESGQDDDALDKEEEFNIDDLLASPVPAEKKSKSKKRRKLPPDLSSKDHRDGHGGPGHDGDGHGGPGHDGDGHGGLDGGCGAPVEVGNYF